MNLTAGDRIGKHKEKVDSCSTEDRKRNKIVFIHRQRNCLYRNPKECTKG